ncbi:MAG: hypothetical protein UR27_C0017G0001, partial [Candidatus Peregrinibacteria bacterium GW2011_GWA2_33_10]
FGFSIVYIKDSFDYQLNYVIGLANALLIYLFFYLIKDQQNNND